MRLVQRIENPHHPRGYRELRSPAEMRKLLKRKVVEQDGRCAICHEEFTDFHDVVPGHRNPKGMGGAWRDDHWDNVQAAHWWCNEEKGQPEWTGNGRLVGLRPRFRFKLYDINHLPRKQSPHGGA